MDQKDILPVLYVQSPFLSRMTSHQVRVHIKKGHKAVSCTFEFRKLLGRTNKESFGQVNDLVHRFENGKKNSKKVKNLI